MTRHSSAYNRRKWQQDNKTFTALSAVPS